MNSYMLIRLVMVVVVVVVVVVMVMVVMVMVVVVVLVVVVVVVVIVVVVVAVVLVMLSRRSDGRRRPTSALELRDDETQTTERHAVNHTATATRSNKRQHAARPCAFFVP